MMKILIVIQLGIVASSPGLDWFKRDDSAEPPTSATAIVPTRLTVIKPKEKPKIKRNYTTLKKEIVATNAFLIACHTTDMECFKRQYRALRDRLLDGIYNMAVPKYEPYRVIYGDSGTCIQFTGLEDSQLTGIQLDSDAMEYSITIEMPFKIEQVKMTSVFCDQPEYPFAVATLYSGHLKKFTGNATVLVTYPYQLRSKRGHEFLLLKEENMDVILDIPDLTQHNDTDPFQHGLFEISEWAYSIVQHIDAAKHVALPFTSKLHRIMDVMPLRRFIILYPDESYPKLNFKLTEPVQKCYENRVNYGSSKKK